MRTVILVQISKSHCMFKLGSSCCTSTSRIFSMQFVYFLIPQFRPNMFKLFLFWILLFQMNPFLIGKSFRKLFGLSCFSSRLTFLLIYYLSFCFHFLNFAFVNILIYNPAFSMELFILTITLILFIVFIVLVISWMASAS